MVATGSVLDLLHLLRLGMGRAQSGIAFFTPTTFRPVAAAAVLDRHDEDGGEANGRNFRRWRSSLPSVLSSTAVASS